MANSGFSGLKVLVLETRRGEEVSKLIRAHGGEPNVVSAVREVPLESNQEAFAFAERLLRGDFGLVIFTTGTGARRLMEIIESRYDRARILAALRGTKLAARGPKTASALRAMDLPVAVTAPDPGTWRELMSSLDGAFSGSFAGMRAAVQEYGAPNPDLLDALTQRGVEWMRVPVYHWALPEDTEPLYEAVRSIISGSIDFAVFLSAIQVVHLFQIADTIEAGSALTIGLKRTVVLSIGPSTSEELRRHGINPDFEPSHPRMGFLISEAAGEASRLLAQKRSR